MLKTIIIITTISISLHLVSCTNATQKNNKDTIISQSTTQLTHKKITKITIPFDTIQYQMLVKKLANGDTTGKWPVKSAPVPTLGAILPFKRIIAYYGNLYSKNMGILGAYKPKDMWTKLNAEVTKWNKADGSTKAIPALHYIAVVAQGSAGKDGKYRFRMPESQIDSVLNIANMGKALVFLDIQVALSNIEQELPRLEKYLKLPHVHLGIDPEFSMKTGKKPGSVIGTFDAKDINYASKYLAELVRKDNLPAKILIIHRFTKNMLTNYKQIKLYPEVQTVINMDGWGAPQLKINTYRSYIYQQPVQFTGFKLFYKNDLKKNGKMMSPEQILKLTPKPIYIQYQ